jgi:hypothetical protein
MMTPGPHRDPALRTLLILALVILALPGHAAAALGGDAVSVRDDQAHLKGSLRVAETDTGAVHELRVGSATVVREYADRDGTVFGVAWEGPWLPDLRQLLGPYFDQYANAARARRRTRGALVLHEPGLVVEISGHMRAFVGRAYVPEMVPAAVQMDTIR